ncbi:hypothetical protein M422DRAFT_39173 [Sphaerobolus stellatus SS14]|uniref:Ricin B lectin domain-containing protein n=1 Tax=Sphaerobolus stellatus (strain SS14) TaxID=990650 RepID=A0A0C9TRC9_SPHS4|nr:hypothetical protein M422DRAFT_39173 [Sphaerobolus stellatus SS14]
MQFSDGSSGTNLTSWRFSGKEEQMWEFTSVITNDSDRPAYYILNVKYQNYAFWEGQPGSGQRFIFANQVTSLWYTEQINGSYTISPFPDFTYSWNVQNADNGNDINVHSVGNTWPNTDTLFYGKFR